MAPILYYFRLTLYTINLISVSFLAVFIGAVSTLLGKRLNTNHYVARLFWRTAGPLIGWKFEVEGEEHLRNLQDTGDEQIEGDANIPGRCSVIIGNHQRCVLWLELRVSYR